jgi:ankyrin repeat protein
MEEVPPILIAYGAKVNWENNHGHTALGEAMKNRNYRTAIALLDAGAKWKDVKIRKDNDLFKFKYNPEEKIKTPLDVPAVLREFGLTVD